MSTDGANTQRIYLDELSDDAPQGGRKASRIELRTLRDAYNLRTVDDMMLDEKRADEEDEIDSVQLRRLTAYCTAESYKLRPLVSFLHRSPRIDKVQVYFGECVYASYRLGENEFRDLFFINYGVVVMWGLEEKDEQEVLRMIRCVEENQYDLKSIEVENFKYGLAKNSQIVNDKILLSGENALIKLVISIAIAQSVKLDYFEELVENTIDTIKDLPEEVEKEGKVGKKRQEILKIMGKLHKLSFNLYIVSNILAEPEFVWEYSSYSPLYETCVRYLDIKTRADLLNKRCETIHGMLQILSENITTHNSEKLEWIMTVLIGVSAISGILQCLLLLFIVFTSKLSK